MGNGTKRNRSSRGRKDGQGSDTRDEVKFKLLSSSQMGGRRGQDKRRRRAVTRDRNEMGKSKPPHHQLLLTVGGEKGMCDPVEKHI